MVTFLSQKLPLPCNNSLLTSAVMSSGGGTDANPSQYERKTIELSLYDLDQDPGESTNVPCANPDVVKRLLDYEERARAGLGDSLTKRTGANVRPAGRT